jgi:hypothetical protein
MEVKGRPLLAVPAAALVARHNFSGGTALALRLFLMNENMTRNQAAKAAGVDPAVVSRGLARISTTVECPCCGTGYRTLNI